MCLLKRIDVNVVVVVLCCSSSLFSLFSFSLPLGSATVYSRGNNGILYSIVIMILTWMAVRPYLLGLLTVPRGAPSSILTRVASSAFAAALVISLIIFSSTWVVPFAVAAAVAIASIVSWSAIPNDTSTNDLDGGLDGQSFNHGFKMGADEPPPVREKWQRFLMIFRSIASIRWWRVPFYLHPSARLANH